MKEFVLVLSAMTASHFAAIVRRRTLLQKLNFRVAGSWPFEGSIGSRCS
jgi:hypothetical protein